MGFITPHSIDKEHWSETLIASRDRILHGLGRLGAGLPEKLQEDLRGTLEVVNSYYSNRMEGNPTRIGDIFAAQEGHLASTRAERNYQLEHLAHLQVSAHIRDALSTNPGLSPCSREFLK